MSTERPEPGLTLHAAPSDALTPEFADDLRTMLEAAFNGEFSDEDWRHALGGTHVWLADSSMLVSHASVVERTLQCSGETLRVGYVEAVATAGAHRRKGHGRRVMAHVGDLIRARYALGALSTGSHVFYESLGWERWRGPTSVQGPRGTERTCDDDGSVMILRTSRSPTLDLDRTIVCTWRPGDVW